MPKTKQREAQMLGLVDPRFVSVVQSPANRSGFKIIRSEDGKLVKTGKPRRRVKAKRSDSDLLHITLPYGMTREDAEAVMTKFGLNDDYTISEVGGTFILVREDLDTLPENTIEIPLANGMTAIVAASAFAQRKENDIPGVKVVELEFDERFEEVESVRAWLDERTIVPKGVEQVDGGFFVSLSDHDGPTKKVVIDEGVTGCVIRAAQNDVPKAILRSVLQQSYGNWGWGHLDFSAAMADPVYSEQSAMAYDAFREVLDNIVFFSGLDLDQRKSLIQNACSQYASFMSNLIDAMPRPVLEEARSQEANRQEVEMTDRNKAEQAAQEAQRAEEEQSAIQAAATQEAEEASRSEEQAEGETAAAAEEGAEEATRSEEQQEASTDDKGDDAPVTRGELKALVAEAFAEAMGKNKDEQQEEPAARSEEQTKNDDLLTVVRGLADTVKTLTETVEEMGGTTVSRSDHGDEPEGNNAKRDVFEGTFGNLGGLRP